MPKGDHHDIEEAARHATVFDIDTQRVARVYAEALLAAAQKAGLEDVILEHIEALTGDMFRRNPDIAAMFSTGFIARGRRAKAIRNGFEGRSDPLFLNFLLVLNKHDRLQILPAVTRAYRELLDERARRVRVLVSSAVPLNDAQRDEVKSFAHKLGDLKPELVETVDPELLGGLRLQVGDHVFDATVQNRLQTIKNQLLARSSYAIQSGRDRFRT